MSARRRQVEGVSLTIEDVMEELSPSQRAAVLWLPADGTERQRERGRAAPATASFYVLANWVKGDPARTVSLHAKFVSISPSRPATPGSGQIWAPTTYCLTPLGQQLRAAIERQEKEQ